MKALKYSSILFFALFSVTSCQNDELVKSEQEQTIDYLVANGFTIQDANNTTDNYKQVPSLSLEEARKLVNELKRIDNLYSEKEIRSLTKADSRTGLIACEDAGTFYVSRAIDGGSSGVDVQYTRTETGEIVNIFSYSTGFQVAWSWDQIGVNVINPDVELCIDGVMTYGLDLGGVLLGYRAAVALRVKWRGCVAEVTSTYGHC